MGDVTREELEAPELRNHEEGDIYRNLRKRRLTMALKLDEKSEDLLEEMIIERGIRDGSINWMVVAAMSSWRSDDYSDVLINYFGENAVREEGGAVEMNTNCADGPKSEERVPAQKTVDTDPSQNSLKKGRWLCICKDHPLHP
jgi:hypothetical protein